jgi:transcriptional regulator with XRE-family HTH domain
MSKESEAPFVSLGKRLRSLRTRKRESIAEAAGAVEIAEEELEQIEEGNRRPTEEILMLLINHFGTREDEAVQLWEMAGYDADEDHDDLQNEANQLAKTIVLAVTMDPRIMYSDTVQVNGNKHGIVMNFMQPGGGNLPAMPVSRIGMSREQARKLADLLDETLTLLDKADKPRQLPNTSQNNQNNA